ncbi:SDR family oxidoreductase [Actinocorallia libanotica]|uniref:SDR family oxidoreductase n=1 Tax=Actinocorallia libanotica TaxID=46162 RepID=A0ABN1RUF9_9ACTN
MKQNALITGAGRGIGAATALELGRRGFHVIVDYRDDAASAASVVERVEEAGGTAHAVRADVRHPGQVAEMVRECGRIDALVCNANIRPPFAPLAEMAWEEFSAKVTGELAAVFHITRLALDVMRGQGGGRIVYVSSLSADLLRPGTIAHATAKAALDTFARHVAAEAAPHGIAVNTVAPGGVRTDASASMRTPEAEEALASRSILRRMLEPQDVAGVIGALLGGGFDAVSGVRVAVDAGRGLFPG